MAFSAELEINVSESLSISCILYDADIERLILSLDKGYESEITIQARLFRKRKKPISIFGDELIKEIQIIKRAEKDFFSDSYIVNEISQKYYFENKVSFLNNYFQNTIEVLPKNIPIDELSLFYVKVRATLVNKLFIQPLNILNLLNYRNKSTTGWISLNLKQDH